MIKTRIASFAAVYTFGGLAALSGVVVAVAAPANAAPSNEHAAGSTSTSAHAGSPSKPSREAHLIPGFKPRPITTSASNAANASLGATGKASDFHFVENPSGKDTFVHISAITSANSNDPTATLGSTPTSTSASAETNQQTTTRPTLPPEEQAKIDELFKRAAADKEKA